MSIEFFAHTHTRFAWEPLSNHLEAVAKSTADSAAAFGAADWGRVLGQWHDLGKYSQAFQRYLCQSQDVDAGEEETSPRRVDHSTFGAKHAMDSIEHPIVAQILAACVAGHHAGLPDATAQGSESGKASLEYRLTAGPPRVPEVALPFVPDPPPLLRLPIKAEGGILGFQVAFFTRMLFSSLIDADRTATEAYCDPERAAARARTKPSISELRQQLDIYLAQFSTFTGEVNGVRAGVLEECRSAANHRVGFFSLNVPTGGGKTVSSLAFALAHARSHGLRRVVVAIPFTSIIEQTADVYRQALGPLANLGLLEHHSNVEPRKQTRETNFAAENWDAPVVVTTNVQLYESLFSAGTTPCRKLHRLARSVIILDEAQTLPVDLLKPTLLALRELVRSYGCTVVMCTATQPALVYHEKDFEIGIPREEIHEIVRDVPALHARLKRVDVIPLGKLEDESLADRIAAERAVLCIVNSRPHAAALFEKVAERTGKEGCFHLSTYMCAQHRREVLAMIRSRLKEKQCCRLVSTSLIEAGVDVDFPAVFRAPAGFDAMAQAAGRCNREGTLTQEDRPARGRVYLFETESLPPAGLLRAAAQTAKELLPRHPDPLLPASIEAYFRLFYWSRQHEWDRHQVLESLDDDQIRYKKPKGVLYRQQFREAAKRYQLIRDEQVPILVPFNEEARRLIQRLRRGEPADYAALRQAQRYLVSVREAGLAKLREQQVVMALATDVEAHESGLWLLCNEAAYRQETGLYFDAVGYDPAELMA